MITPSWEPSAGSLAAWLATTTQAIPVDLWTITRLDGTVLRYSGLDTGIAAGGKTWGLGPNIKRSNVRRGASIEVDTLTMEVFADSSVCVGAVPIIQAFASGMFRGATVLLERAYLDDALVVKGIIKRFFGRVGQVSASRGRVSVEVRSGAELLDVKIPAAVYQPGCRNTLFDPQCGLVDSAVRVAATVNVATTATLNTFSTGATAKAAGWFDNGVVEVMSGANAGVRRTIRTHTVSTRDNFTVIAPFPYALAVGATVRLYPGCDKTRSTCVTKFANGSRFSGEPWIPAPETVT